MRLRRSFCPQIARLDVQPALSSGMRFCLPHSMKIWSDSAGSAGRGQREGRLGEGPAAGTYRADSGHSIVCSWAPGCPSGLFHPYCTTLHTMSLAALCPCSHDPGHGGLWCRQDHGLQGRTWPVVFRAIRIDGSLAWCLNAMAPAPQLLVCQSYRHRGRAWTSMSLIMPLLGRPCPVAAELGPSPARPVFAWPQRVVIREPECTSTGDKSEGLLCKDISSSPLSNFEPSATL